MKCIKKGILKGGEEMKELYKSNKNKMIFGVCGGIGEFFGISATLIRLLFVILALSWGSGVLLYIIMAIIMPSSNVYR